MRNLFLVSAMMLGLASPAGAATVWNETVDGDTGPSNGAVFLIDSNPSTDSTSLGTLFGFSEIFGSVQGSGTLDRTDLYQFTVTASFTIDILSFFPGASNTSSIFVLYSGSPSSPSGGSTVSVTGTLSNLFGTLAAGTYTLGVAEGFSLTPATYHIGINAAPSAVPLPASGPLAVAAFAALALLRRRKSVSN